MAKTIRLLLVTVSVLAATVPASASAKETGLTQGGKLVPIDKIITGTNVSTSNVKNLRVDTARTGTLTCEPGLVMVEGELNSNSATLVHAFFGKSKSYTANCKSSTGVVDLLKVAKLVEIGTVGGGGKGTFSIKLAFEFPGGGICEWSGNDNWTYSTTETAEGGNVIEFVEEPLTATVGACGNAKLTGAFSLATQGTATKVYLM